ncbi:hypothetical protein EVAR_38535_1 [Eumeta japonica]|uniref:Uncharacterized protein n=1 Tax=Eumeta variegata TaxID=151549 RepID=A0A4C1WCD4_EUMVA|nr:hypothetical protein EVAR_38535_1 [Eumeta japonica]
MALRSGRLGSQSLRLATGPFLMLHCAPQREPGATQSHCKETSYLRLFPSPWPAVGSSGGSGRPGPRWRPLYRRRGTATDRSRFSSDAAYRMLPL